ncbi:hypothetical protein ACFE04_017935 [Oxalis oulophora]
MVGFGKKLKQSQIQEWQRYYIDYKFLKKKLNRYSQQIEVGTQGHDHVLKDFSRVLDSQIQKIVLFLLQKQGLLATRSAVLGNHHTPLLKHSNSNTLNIPVLQEAYRDIGRDLLKLLHFVEINATSLRKILKKFDKRFGYKFTHYYVKTRSNHPYSQLKQVFRHVAIGAVVGAISRNLAVLQNHQDSLVSIYDQPYLSHPDPVVESIHAAVNRLSFSTNFLQFREKHALIIHEDSTTPSEEHDIEDRYHFMSIVLNLVNTFLYMVNTYIVVPTADTYSFSLGAPATVCGVVIGAMAIAQVFSSVYFSAWSNRSYFRPLIFSSIVLFIGNTMYALAYDFNSITILLMGRLFCGFGSTRAVNRRYISDCVPLKFRMQASAGFVSASALGMATGPALACLFQTNFKIFNLTFNEETLPGWFMALSWLVYLLWLWISFQEPPFQTMEFNTPPEANTGLLVNDSVENGLSQPFLAITEAKQQNGDGAQQLDNGKQDSQEIHKPVTSIIMAYQLLTPSVKVQLFVYFMLKYAMEIILAESSVITSWYFTWSTNNVAIFLACLGLTVLPVNIIVGNYASNMFEERQLLLASEIMVCVGILLSFNILQSYTVPQYVGSAMITFVSAEVLEGVNLSLLSRVMSSRLSRGTFNGGLLSKEAGTLARVVADGSITLCGYLGEGMLLNVTLVPALFICVSSIVATCFTYNSLY